MFAFKNAIVGTSVYFFFALTAVSQEPQPVPAPIEACHPSLKVPSVDACPEFTAASNAAGFSGCQPNECQIRVYAVVGKPTIETSNAPPCCPRYDVRDQNGDYSQDCGRCAGLVVDLPAGTKMTRYRVAAADRNGEGYCGDQLPGDRTPCSALPYSSFGSFYEQKLPNGGTRITVQFKNWNNRENRRGALAVWFTPVTSSPTARRHWWQIWKPRRAA